MAYHRCIIVYRRKSRYSIYRQIIINTVIPLIIFHSFATFNEEYSTLLNTENNLNTFNENKLSNILRPFPEAIQHINQKNAAALTIPNEPRPELRRLFAWSDKEFKPDVTETGNVTLTTSPHLGTCSHTSPTYAVPSYTNKAAVTDNNLISKTYSDGIYLKPLIQNMSKSETVREHYLNGKNLVRYKSLDKKRSLLEFEADLYDIKVTENYHLSSLTNNSSIDFEGSNDDRDAFKFKYFTLKQTPQISKYITSRIVQPKNIEKTVSEQVISISRKLFVNIKVVVCNINVIEKYVGVCSNNKDNIIDNNQIHNYLYGSYTDHSKLSIVILKSAKSPGNVLQPSKLIIAISFLLMVYPAQPIHAGIGPTPQDVNKLKVIYTLNTVGQSVLLAVYQHVKPFNFYKNIKDHLMQDLGWSNRRYRETFDKTQRNIIENSANSGQDYDISLLFKCLLVLSKHYEPDTEGQSKWNDGQQLECRCKNLKNMRNEEFHSVSGINEADMRRKIYDVENLLMGILDSLTNRIDPSESRNIDDTRTKIQSKISNILSHDLGVSQIRTCISQRNLKLLTDEIPSYKISCKDWGKMKILDFLLGSEKEYDVKLLFSTEIIVEKSTRHKQSSQVECTDIFKMDASISIVLIDSEAGGGKTTIFRKGMNSYGEGGSDMNTDDYDLIFPMLFRNPRIDSVQDLIGNMIPNVRDKIGIEGIMNCITNPSQSILFLCDGYDESNLKSTQLFKEILDLNKTFHHIRLIVTSRPESVQNFFYSIGQNHSIEHLKVKGIIESKRASFLKTYHDEFIKANESRQSSEDLLSFYEGISARHKELYRLPINLVILAYLWGKDSDRAKTIRSAAGLYEAIMDILNEKLIARIAQFKPECIQKVDNDINKLKRHIVNFKKMVYDISLDAVRLDQVYIDENSVDKLNAYCDNVGLPAPELKGAFLFSKLEWENVNSLKEILELPHKGFLDYYAAKCIEDRLISKANESESQYVAKGHEVSQDDTKPKQNMLDKLLRIFHRKDKGYPNSSTVSSSRNKPNENKRENCIKKIILDSYGEDSKELNLTKYQNILQILGGVIALRDIRLVEEFGQDIIGLLIETGVSNNSQWYDIYSDFNVNDSAAEKFGKLIAPHLNFDNFTIKAADVEILCTLFKHIEVDNVKLDISSSDKPPHLPALMDLLSEKNCTVNIPDSDFFSLFTS